MMKKILFLPFLFLTATLFAGQATYSVVWVKLNANTPQLVRTGYVNTHPSNLNSGSYWSVGCETLDRDFAVFDNYREFLGQTGVGYARFQSGWAKTEQKKGKYDFKWLDEQIDGCLQQGVRPWLCLSYANPIYADGGKDLGSKIFPEGPIMDAWVKYVEAVVKRYKGRIRMYEVWNEPERDEQPELYGALFVNTAKAIRRTDPGVKIAAFGAISPEHSYIRQALSYIKEAGAIDLVDYITYHAYWSIPEDITPQVQKLQEEARTYSDKICLLQGEAGCPSQLEYGHALYSYEWTETAQVKWDCRNMMNHFSLGIPYSVFTMVDLNYGWMLQSFGLLRMNLKKEVQYRRPKYYMVQNVTSIITPDLTADRNAGIEVETSRQVETFAVKKDGHPIGFALWFNGNIPSNDLGRENVTVTVRDFGMKDPVYVDLVTGAVYELYENVAEVCFLNPEASEANKRYPTTCKFLNLPIWDAPVLIIERSAVDIIKSREDVCPGKTFWPTRDFKYNN